MCDHLWDLSRSDCDIRALRPDLWGLLAIPTERDNVLAGGNFRHKDLVNNAPLEELGVSLVLCAVVAAKLTQLVAVRGVHNLVAPKARTHSETTEQEAWAVAILTRWRELEGGCLRGAVLAWESRDMAAEVE